MRKKLIFVNNIEDKIETVVERLTKSHSLIAPKIKFNRRESLYIVIKNGKIRQYIGAELIRTIIQGEQKLEIKTLPLDDDFQLEKISKYDRKRLVSSQV